MKSVSGRMHRIRAVLVVLVLIGALLPRVALASHEGRVYGTGGEGVWLKAEPNLQSARLALLPEGTAFHLIQGPLRAGDQLWWARVDALGQEGWIVAEYLLMNNTPAPANTTPADEPVTAAAPTTLTIGGWAKVINTFSTPGLRLRSAPAPWEELLAVIPEGSLLRIINGPTPGGNGNPWYEVSADGQKGWVDSTYLEPAATPTVASTPPAPAPLVAPSATPSAAPTTGGLAAGAWAEVNGTTGTSGLRLRVAPSPWEKLIAILPEGTKLKILEGPARGGNGDPWYRVAWDGSWGWVTGTYLIPTTASSGTPVTPTPTAAPAPGTGNGATLVQFARAQVGKPYAWGAAGPDSFDCSGLIVYAARKALGLTMPRVAADQAFAGVHVDYANLAPGDLVFYANTYQPGISHVGIFIGNGQWITASDEITGVIVASMDEPYWKSRYAGARRIT